MNAMFEAVLMALLVGYVTYRLSFTIRAARAKRAGDVQTANSLRVHGTALMLGTGIGVTFLAVGWLLFAR